MVQTSVLDRHYPTLELQPDTPNIKILKSLNIINAESRCPDIASQYITFREAARRTSVSLRPEVTLISLLRYALVYNLT